MSMSILQHPQMRAQGMVSNNMQSNQMGQVQGGVGQNTSHLGSQQLNLPLNQQILSHAQQQNILQQNSSQVCNFFL